MATAAARRYARAVFELAQQEGQVAEWERRITRVREVLTDPAIAAVLTNPTIATAERMALVSPASRGGGGGLDRETANLAGLLIESNRVRDIDEIAIEFEKLTDAAAGRVRATVTTAVELTDSDRVRVADELSKRLGKEVTMDVVVDPRILGGMKLQYGDRLVDASVSTKLQQLRRRLAAT